MHFYHYHYYHYCCYFGIVIIIIIILLLLLLLLLSSLSLLLLSLYHYYITIIIIIITIITIIIIIIIIIIITIIIIIIIMWQGVDRVDKPGPVTQLQIQVSDDGDLCTPRSLQVENMEANTTTISRCTESGQFHIDVVLKQGSLPGFIWHIATKNRNPTKQD